MMEQFSFDVFLNYSSKDKSVVRQIAERLRSDGLTVWFDEWILKPGDNVPVEIEDGLEHSRVLVLCMSANAFASDWEQLEARLFRFRDPLNPERRFIPLRLDSAPVKSSLDRVFYIDWRSEDREQEYARLLDACRPASPGVVGAEIHATKSIELEQNSEVYFYAFSPDRKQVLTSAQDAILNLWDLETEHCLNVFKHDASVQAAVWTADQQYFVSGDTGQNIGLWDVRTATRLRTLKAHLGPITTLAWSPDQRYLASGSGDTTIRVWDMETGRCLRVLEGHSSSLYCLAWNHDGQLLISGSYDNTLKLWNTTTGKCLRSFKGHTGCVHSVAWEPVRNLFLSGSFDRTLRLWNAETGACLHVLEGHTDRINHLSWSVDPRFVVSASEDNTVRLWDMDAGTCIRVLKGHNRDVRTVVWANDGSTVFSGDYGRNVRIWNVQFITKPVSSLPGAARSESTRNQVQYTNAKVLLVGESGAGKTGLSKRLTSNNWEPTDSTVGAWATQWKLAVSSNSVVSESEKRAERVEREIWLWDFGGQADQRLIHQLYMDETALAVLVFDGQKEDVFDTLGQWDRDLTRAARKEFAKLLVAGRVDAGGLRVSRNELEKFAAERKFRGFLETSAKTNLGCDELKDAILNGVNWDEIPCRTTEVLFKRLKEEIIRLKDAGRVLTRFNELRQTLQLRLSGEFKQFSDDELRTVLTLLAGPCVVWELAFGSWVLLQPERINAYAQAVIRTLQEDEYQRGCLMEERVLSGDLIYESSMERLLGDEERFVLLAMHQTLVERGLCLRQPTAKGNLLVFPSYYRRERPEQVKFPAVLVHYRFNGFLDDIYATLVVRLHHTESFQQDELWRYAADFKTNTGKQLGVKLTRVAPGVGELEVYFEPTVSIEEKIIFSKYVHEHLLQHARDVQRLRHYVCGECGTPVGNREVAMQRLHDWLQIQPPDAVVKKSFKFRKTSNKPPSIICVSCEKRVPLWDEMEQSFASPEIQQRVRDMQDESAIVLDNESRERVLVGEVISTVALAGQICREFNVSDHGIDMEIEFKDDSHEATAAKVYLQLKSGDSYTRRRKRDGVDIFTIKDERHVRYWMAQPFPVLLIIRSSEGEVRWMEVRDWLKRASEDGQKPVNQIVFEGERFDVMSVRRWRDRVLGGAAT